MSAESEIWTVRVAKVRERELVKRIIDQHEIVDSNTRGTSQGCSRHKRLVLRHDPGICGEFDPRTGLHSDRFRPTWRDRDRDRDVVDEETMMMVMMRMRTYYEIHRL